MEAVSGSFIGRACMQNTHREREIQIEKEAQEG